ncbi:MAG: hypothetical protein ABIH85_00165 [Candidatus Omnitrophota bacterium]
MWLTEKSINYVPNIILAELKKYYSEKIIKQKSNNIKEYKKKIGEVISLVEYASNKSNGSCFNFFHNIDINRHHIINVCTVCEKENITPPTPHWKKSPITQKKEKNLSYADILLLAISIELRHIHRDKVFILSNDERIYDVANYSPEIFPRCIDITKEDPMEDIVKKIEHYTK